MDLSNRWTNVRIKIVRNRSDRVILENVECIPDQVTWLQLLHSYEKYGFDEEHHEIQALLHRASQQKTPIPTCRLNCLVSHILDKWKQTPRAGIFKVHLVEKAFPTALSFPGAPVNQSGILPMTRFVCQRDDGPPMEVTPFNLDNVKQRAPDVIHKMPPEILSKISLQQLELGRRFNPTEFQALAMPPTALIEVRNPMGQPQASAAQYQMMQGPGLFAKLGQNYEHVGWHYVNVYQGKILPEFTPPWNTQSQQQVQRNRGPALLVHPNNLRTIYGHAGNLAFETPAPTRQVIIAAQESQPAVSTPPAQRQSTPQPSTSYVQGPAVLPPMNPGPSSNRPF